MLFDSEGANVVSVIDVDSEGGFVKSEYDSKKSELFLSKGSEFGAKSELFLCKGSGFDARVGSGDTVGAGEMVGAGVDKTILWGCFTSVTLNDKVCNFVRIISGLFVVQFWKSIG